MPARRLASVLALCVLTGATTGCSRKVVVTTPSGPRPVALAVKVTNTSAQAVTVTVIGAGPELTLGVVAANSTAVLAVPQVPSGATVTLRAQLADGSRAYTRDGVVLTGTYEWRVP